LHVIPSAVIVRPIVFIFAMLACAQPI
jgi:hypothetical protein